jgi:uncharacterized protein (UPF0335 family)
MYSDITNRGFKKHFTEAELIDGYSTDWNRVHHGYLSAAGHYMANLPFQKDYQAMEQTLSFIEDPKLKARLQSFLDYTNSPAEDLVGLRTFNFLWTMGGNLSTSALQVFTLPTTTLGGMTQYNPNVLENMQLISKWFTIGAQLAPKEVSLGENAEGIISLNFADRQKLNRLIKKGTIDEETAVHIIRQYQEGLTRGMVTEESLGSRPFETRSAVGAARGKARTISSYLGMPVTIMEQLTRFATDNAMRELIAKNPQAKQRAFETLKDNPLFAAKQKLNPDRDVSSLLAEFAMDEAHGVFGKIGRAEVMRGVGGALVFPFMTYPQHAMEFMFRMMTKRGKHGRRGAITTVAALYLLSGLMGLPGGELLKELYEELEKQITGSEEDLDMLIRQRVYEATGSPRFAKFITQGMGRGWADIDVSRRIGLPIWFQEVVFNMLGIRGDSSDVLGVSGSMISGIGQAWQEYNTGGSATKVLSAMMPVTAANVMNAYNYSQDGVSTRRGVQLVRPEDITNRTMLLKAFGVTSDQIATKREELYYSQVLEKRHQTGIERFRERGKKLVTAKRRAMQKNNHEEVRRLEAELKRVRMELKEYVKENKIPGFDYAAFMRSLYVAARQRTAERMTPKDVRKAARGELPDLQRALGTLE